MSSLRVAKTNQEIVGICLIERERYRRADVHGQTEFMRNVWNRPTSLALI